MAVTVAENVPARHQHADPGRPAQADGTARPAREFVVLALFLVLATGLRLNELGAGLWHDEIATLIHNVRAPWGILLTSFESQNNHPLYSILAKLSILTLGDTPAALRLPAVLFGVGSIAALYWFGVHVTQPREALTAAGLLSVSYHHVWFSQNARAYTALLFFALVGTTLCLRMCRSPLAVSRATALTYAGVMVLALYSHLTAGVILAAHAAVWVVVAVKAGGWRGALRSRAVAGFFLAGFIPLLLYAPGLMSIAAGLGGSGPKVDIAWTDPIWMVAEMLRVLAVAVPGGMPTLLLGAIVPLVGVARYATQDRAATALMLLPVALTASFLLATGHNLWPRFFFFAAGFAVLILMRGMFFLLKKLWPRQSELLTAVVAVVMLAGSAFLVPRAWGDKQDYRGALEYVQANRAEGDAVATIGIAGFTYQNYLLVDWPAVDTREELSDLGAGRERVWLVYWMPELIAARSPELWHAVNRDFRTAATFPGTLAGGAIHVAVKP